MNSDLAYEDRNSRHRGDRIAAAVAVAFTLAFTVGLTWWVSDRAALQGAWGMFGDQPTADAATQGDTVLPGPLPAAPADIANGQAVGTTTIGTITQVDAGQRTLTLDNGQTYALIENMPLDNFPPGTRVLLTYVPENNRNVATRIQPATNNVAPLVP